VTAVATRTATMTAATVESPGLARSVVVERPRPGPGEVLVRIEGCGVCGSSLPVWEGRPWFEYPLAPGAPGHEGWGVIDELGAGVDEPRLGTRVALLSQNAFAEYDVAAANEVVPLPPALDGIAFPGEAVGCAVNVIRRSDIRPGDRVAVVGVGFLGALLVALAVEQRARVTAVSRRRFALDLARRLGAEATMTLDEPPEGEFDRVLEAAGVQETLDVAGRLVAVGGRLVIAGFHQDGPRTVDLQVWNWRGLDIVNAHERDPAVVVGGMRDAVRLVASGRLDLAPLLTHAYPLERAGEAFDAARLRPEGFLKAVVLT
jgi:2-desacetyl-2-hydroxyethyl bacteriochlorophyllide A dehydrogenase